MRIAISQRADPALHERRDALDQRWAPQLESLGAVPVPLPNGLHDPQAWACALGIEGVLLSGGNDLCGLPGASGEAAERDRSEALLLDLAHARRWPVLGVCRGFQMLNRYLGGTLTAVEGHVAMRHALYPTAHRARLLPTDPKVIDVNSFHRFGVAAEGLAEPLVPVFCDAQGFVEAAEHRLLPWAGVMWHPEREAVLGEPDRALLSRLFALA
jgi:putative glutamine amidotransferase